VFLGVAYPSQEHSIDTTDQDIKDQKDGLPPLRNPPLLETADDLATLSHLNEPSGTRFPFVAGSI
jgi:myosin heavy subunit